MNTKALEKDLFEIRHRHASKISDYYKEKQVSASTSIQKHWRGYLARKRVSQLQKTESQVDLLELLDLDEPRPLLQEEIEQRRRVILTRIKEKAATRGVLEAEQSRQQLIERCRVLDNLLSRKQYEPPYRFNNKVINNVVHWISEMKLFEYAAFDSNLPEFHSGTFPKTTLADKTLHKAWLNRAHLEWYQNPPLNDSEWNVQDDEFDSWISTLVI